MRFNHYEKLRLDTIKAVQEERTKINCGMVNNHHTKYSKSIIPDVNSLFQNDSRFRIIKENEKKQLLKIKQRQKMEIKTMIEFEINQAIIKKNNDDKIDCQKIKEKQFKLELFKKQKEHEEFKQKKLNEKKFMIRKEIEDQLRKTKDYLIEEQKKLLEEIEKDKQKKFFKIKKAEETKMKSFSYKLYSEKLIKNEQQNLIERQKIEEEKEKIRKEQEDREKLEHQKEVERIRREFIIRLQNTRKEQENQNMQLKEQYANKQIYNEQKKIKFEKLRELALKQHKDKIMKKNDEVYNNMQKNRLDDLKKIENYNRKEELNEIKAYEKKNSIMLLNREKSLKIREKDEKVNEHKIENEMEYKKKVNEILDKIDKTEKKVIQTKNSFEREMMFRQEKSTLKKMEKLKIIKRINNVVEYEKEQIASQLREKNEVLEMLKTQKMRVNDKRKDFSEHLLKQKQEVMVKFDLMMKKNKGISVRY
jgi:hypothetical protein